MYYTAYGKLADNTLTHCCFVVVAELEMRRIEGRRIILDIQEATMLQKSARKMKKEAMKLKV